MNKIRNNGESKKNIAVILASGTGQRMGYLKPKQFTKVAGKTILEHTVCAFQRVPSIDQIYVMITPGYVDEAIYLIDTYEKVTHVIEGSDTRNKTSHKALEAIEDKSCNVLFHDAVRPFVSRRVIEDTIAALNTNSAVDVAIPSADTIIKVTSGIVDSIPSRDTLMRGQTPQGFHYKTIWDAYKIALEDDSFNATDDCGVVRRYLPGVDIAVVKGDEQNIKITYPLDLYLADRLFQLSSSGGEELPPELIRRRLKGKGIVVFGGSQGIGAKIAELCEAYGAKTMAFSRSMNNTDITKPEDVKTSLAIAKNSMGRIDYVVNCAAILEIGKIYNLSDSKILELVTTNYVAQAYISKYSHQYLTETKGQLIMFTSSSYTRGRSDYSLYSSSKAAIVNMAQALAEEWEFEGIRVNVINPERTNTPMRRKAFGKEDGKSLLTPEVVANTTVEVMLSEITGQVFDVRIA